MQAQAIEPALAGNDLVATAQTGTGKTLAFVLPMIQSARNAGAARGHSRGGSEPRPANSPCRSTRPSSRWPHGTGIRAAVVVGGMGERTQLNAIRKGAQVLIATAGRLYDFLGRQLVNLSGVRCWSWTKPTACSTWASSDHRDDHGHDARRPPDAVLFGHHRKLRQHLVETHVPDARAHRGGLRRPSPPRKWTSTCTKSSRIESCGLLENMLRRRRGLVPGVRPDQARRGPAGRSSWRAAGVKTAAIHGDRSQNQRNQALQGIPGRTIPRAGGHRCGGPRHPRGRDLPRGELRSSAGSRRLHPSRGPDGPRGRARAPPPPLARAPNAARLRGSNTCWISE